MTDSDLLSTLIQTHDSGVGRIQAKDVSSITGIPRSAISRYSTGITKCPPDRYDEMVDACEFIADYILYAVKVARKHKKSM